MTELSSLTLQSPPYLKFYHEHIENEDGLRENVFNHIHHKWKYRMMWELRSLETQITNEGGLLIFHDTCELETINFSAELDKKIWSIIHAIDWSKW